jgi:hypothetical protein
VKKRWHDDEFAEPLAIKPVRAPRQETAPLPMGGDETLKALDDLSRILRLGDHKEIARAIGHLRGHLNFVREHWKLNSGIAAGASDRAVQHLNKKHNVESKKREDPMERMRREIDLLARQTRRF